jgi:hypothetical protein
VAAGDHASLEIQLFSIHQSKIVNKNTFGVRAKLFWAFPLEGVLQGHNKNPNLTKSRERMSPDLHSRAITPAPRGPTFRFRKCVNTRLNIRGVLKLIVTTDFLESRMSTSRSQTTQVARKNRSHPKINQETQPETPAPDPLPVRPNQRKKEKDV